MKNVICLLAILFPLCLLAEEPTEEQKADTARLLKEAEADEHERNWAHTGFHSLPPEELIKRDKAHPNRYPHSYRLWVIKRQKFYGKLIKIEKGKLHLRGLDKDEIYLIPETMQMRPEDRKYVAQWKIDKKPPYSTNNMAKMNVPL